MIRGEPPDQYDPSIAILCTRHFNEVKYEIEQLQTPVLEAQTKSQEERCFMCEVRPVPGRTCEACGRELHPQWPALYCSNKCALADG